MNRWQQFWSAVALIGFAGLIAWAATSHAPADSGDAAAWVQAIGSIAALLALFLAQRLDHANARSLRQQEQHERAAAETEFLFLTISNFLVTLEGSATRSTRGTWAPPLVSHARDSMLSVRDALNKIDVGSLPNRRVAVAYMTALQVAVGGQTTLNMIENGLPAQPRPDIFDALVQLIRPHHDFLTAYVERRR